MLYWQDVFDNVQLHTNTNKHLGQRISRASKLLSKLCLKLSSDYLYAQTKRLSPKLTINTQDRFLMVIEIKKKKTNLRSDKSLKKLQIVQFADESIHRTWINRFPKAPRVPENAFEIFCAQTAVRHSAHAQELQDLKYNSQKKNNPNPSKI